MRLSLQWKILIGYLAIGGITLGAAGWLALDAFEAADMDQLRAGLTAQAGIAAQLFAEPLDRAQPDTTATDMLADRLGKSVNARVTVIAPDGTVLGDSYESGEALRRMDNHRSRPEVRDAIEAGVGTSIRRSDTVGIRMLNLALPIRSSRSGERLLGVVRFSLPLTNIEARHRALRGVLGAALGGAFLLSLGLSYFVATGITRPLAQMVEAAVRMTRGEFREKILVRSKDEVADLADILNQMAVSIEETIRTLSDDRTWMAATLTAMQEGVMVLDAMGTVRLVNPAMERMMGRQEAEVIGRTHLEVIRHARLNEFITQVLQEGGAPATEIALGITPARVYQVQASTLSHHDPANPDRSSGAVLAFHDITDLRRLEQVRKDFVANVSHELRTPLTAIKGYVEALQEGVKELPAQRDRFLEVIRTQADRLNLIITDLLLLSKIESGQIPLKQEPVALPALLNRTLGLLHPLIEQKQHTVVRDLPEGLPPALGDEERLGQAFVNLLDNAIKYTPDHGTITVAAAFDGRMVEVSIADTGIGIPPQDIPRVFERFYRVDKARSRELGGTGLGLAIVKHLVEGHGGTVFAESPPGKGSRFRVRLPVASAPARPSRK